MRDHIKTWLLNDYYTPNITAEVILDTLLTPYVPGIIRTQCGTLGELVFVTKEMSILETDGDSRYGNRGTKIDYILAENDGGEDTPVYLVELKTTDSSLKKEQASRYLKNCRDGCFGTVFGDQLLRIVQGTFGRTYAEAFNRRFGKGPWDEQVLLEAFRLVFDVKPFQERYHISASEHDFAAGARSLIKRAGWAQSDSTRSRKYLYTMGQLLDYLFPKGEEPRKLWKKPLRLIYLTPTGSLPSDGFLGVSLQGAAEYLESLDEAPASLLAEIIREIYPT